MRVSDQTLEIACRIPSDGTPTENTIHDLSLDLRDARALIDRLERFAAGNRTGCGTCTTVVNEIVAFTKETACEHEWREVDMYPFKGWKCAKCGATKT